VARAKSSNRLFFAVTLSPDLTQELLELQQRYSAFDCKPVPPENFHLTLSFLGNLSDKLLEQIIDGVQAPDIAPFTSTPASLVYWQKSSLLALLVNDKGGLLARCKRHLEQQLAGLNLFHYDKRAFTPHITLFRQLESPPPLIEVELTNQIQVDQVHLMHSHSLRGRVIYQSIEQWSLQQPSIRQQLLGSTRDPG